MEKYEELEFQKDLKMHDVNIAELEYEVALLKQGKQLLKDMWNVHLKNQRLFKKLKLI